MFKVFLTGASGYIGGQVLRELTRSLPTLSITALVRDSTKAEAIRQAYPHVRTVIGDLDQANLLEQEAGQARIVLHLAATGHLQSVRSIHRGLKRQESSELAYWIQVSGASALAAGELASASFAPGSPSETVFDDLSGVSAIRDVIRAHPSRAVDNYLLDVAAEKSHIKTALVFPPIIYGKGEGPINQRSIQLPELSRVIIEKGHGVQVGKGMSRWGNVHIRDVGRLFCSLAKATIARGNEEALWGENGIYLAGVGELTFGDISAKVARAAKDLGIIQDSSIEELDRTQSDKTLPHGAVLFGTNARSTARRAKELLHWNPKEESIEAEIPKVVAEEDEKRKNATPR